MVRDVWSNLRPHPSCRLFGGTWLCTSLPPGTQVKTWWKIKFHYFNYIIHVTSISILVSFNFLHFDFNYFNSSPVSSISLSPATRVWETSWCQAVPSSPAWHADWLNHLNQPASRGLLGEGPSILDDDRPHKSHISQQQVQQTVSKCWSGRSGRSGLLKPLWNFHGCFNPADLTVRGHCGGHCGSFGKALGKIYQ